MLLVLVFAGPSSVALGFSDDVAPGPLGRLGERGGSTVLDQDAVARGRPLLKTGFPDTSAVLAVGSSVLETLLEVVAFSDLSAGALPKRPPGVGVVAGPFTFAESEDFDSSTFVADLKALGDCALFFWLGAAKRPPPLELLS